MTELFGSRRLTDALLQPLSGADDMASLIAPLPGLLAAAALQQPGGGSRRLTDHDIRMALATVPPAGTPSAFSWSARTARRALGLSAVRRLVSGQARTPDEGVRWAMAQAARGGDGRHPTSSMDRWLSTLTPAGRAAVGAEAITWATRLWSALEWGAFSSPPVIGRDHWWDSPHSSLLALRSRAEVRTELPCPDGAPRSVHLVVLTGPRRPTVRSELCVVGLVEALRSGRSAVPGRVVGWWPDSGHLVRVDIDPAALREGVAAVQRALSGPSRPATSGGQSATAA
jgi:hypothetical protein